MNIQSLHGVWYVKEQLCNLDGILEAIGEQERFHSKVRKQTPH